ncbi:transposase [Microcoleus sp. Pol14C6]|uniref:transposase n=1 Tax=unclassified Microcoleus TaxID=2642155 RepID=UPI002FCEB027
MIVVERLYIDRQHQFYKQFDDLLFLSINPYVHGKYYIMRKHFFTSGSKFGGSRIIRQLSAILKPTDSFQSFPAKIRNQIFKQILKQVVHHWEDCQKSRIAYDRDIPRVSFLPILPQYKHQIWGPNKLCHDNQSLQKRGGDKSNELLYLYQNDVIISTNFPKLIKVGIGLETAIYFVEAAHQKLVRLVDLNSHLIAGIDLGSDHLVALASNKQIFTPTDKKHFKSINQGFNQRRSVLLSKLDQEKSTTCQIQQITFNRNKRLENYFHQTSILIVKRFVDEKIVQLVIGTKFFGTKNIESRKKTNQTLVVIPHIQLVNNITDKAELVRIKVTVTEAYYTSKCSFLDLEPVGKQESYQHKRGKRGLFRSLNKRLINADVNAGLKMIIKFNVNSPLEECPNPRDVFAVSPVRVDPV